jgi:transcriptional regulator with XRE-family HTH domain
MAKHPKFGWKRFGRDLRECRIAADLSLRDIAGDVSVSHPTWSRAENGRPVTVPVFLKLCGWLGVDPQSYLRP